MYSNNICKSWRDRKVAKLAEAFLVLIVLVPLASGAAGDGIHALPTWEEIEPYVAFMALDEDGARGAGHVAVGFQLKDGSFMVYSFGPAGSGLIPGPSQITEPEHYLKDMYEVQTYLSRQGYITYKPFFVDSPSFSGAARCVVSNRDDWYDWNQGPISFSENCLTFGIDVLEAYGVTGLPSQLIHPTPTEYYNHINVKAESTTPVRQLSTLGAQPTETPPAGSQSTDTQTTQLSGSGFLNWLDPYRISDIEAQSGLDTWGGYPIGMGTRKSERAPAEPAWGIPFRSGSSGTSGSSANSAGFDPTAIIDPLFTNNDPAFSNALQAGLG